jgi:phosphoribosylaminoimidazolecarboxamide formyltransferase / IMP cyclohydrolase
MFKNALISCSNKANLAEFLQPFYKNGLRIVSTGGTSKYLRENGLKVIDVSQQTGFDEVMDGRVKTLHPNIHMALLARDEEPEDLKTLKKFDIETFDLVIGNLYPFEDEPSVENIDIGGPSFLRAAAKNFSRITVICDPADYNWVSQKNKLTKEDRQLLAAKVFSHTAAYDSMIAKHFAGENALGFADTAVGGKFVQTLRYGENPQQKAAWFRVAGASGGLHDAKILQGKELSFNNIQDIDACVSTLKEFEGQKACVAVKHNSPCGVATGTTDENTIVKKLIEADPQSIFGGIVACNFKVTLSVAETLGDIFLECIVAPDFHKEAIDFFAKKKNLRLLSWPTYAEKNDEVKYRSVAGGLLLQTEDKVANVWGKDWVVHGDKVTAAKQNDLLTAWRVAAHLKSNAIAIVSDGQTVGLGMGQVNRVDAVEQAIARMKRFHNNKKNCVLASDAFFPFADSIEKIAAAGIYTVIQPGGSVKDSEVIAKAKELGVTLVLTGQRHFLH